MGESTRWRTQTQKLPSKPRPGFDANQPTWDAHTVLVQRGGLEKKALEVEIDNIFPTLLLYYNTYAYSSGMECHVPV